MQYLWNAAYVPFLWNTVQQCSNRSNRVVLPSHGADKRREGTRRRLQYQSAQHPWYFVICKCLECIECTVVGVCWLLEKVNRVTVFKRCTGHSTWSLQVACLSSSPVSPTRNGEKFNLSQHIIVIWLDERSSVDPPLRSLTIPHSCYKPYRDCGSLFHSSSGLTYRKWER